MASNKVFDYVVKLTETSFGKDGLTELDFIFGYAKLVLMNREVLETLFTEEADRADIDKVRSLFTLKKLDPELIKTGLPLLRAGRDKNIEEKDVLAFLESEKSASDALAKLLTVDIPELKVMKQGNSIDDVLSLAKPAQKSEAPKEKEPDKKSEEAKAKKAAKKAGKDIATALKGDKDSEADSSISEETEPVERIGFDELVKKTSHLYECLKRKIFGQDEAIRLFANGFFQSQIFNGEDEGRKGPSATFLFAGPPGVGKTFLASSVADILEMPYLRLDMSEFSKEDSVQRLMGVPKTYKAPKPGDLTEFVRVNPKSIILLDEIEKAHIDVIYQFLQVLDGGILTDECTMKPVNFKKVILIFTTNVGKKLYEDTSIKNLSSTPRSVVMKEIEEEVDERGRKAFPSAICSRFASGNVVMFNRLAAHNFIDIINKKFNEIAGLVKNTYGYEMQIDNRVAPLLLFSQSSRMDARNMSSQSTILIKNELHELGRHALSRDNALNNLKKINMNVDLENESADIKRLFVNEETAQVLYIGDPAEMKRVPSSKKFKIVNTDKDHVLEDIAKKDISFVLINMKYDSSDNEKGYLSLDDVKNEAVVSFELVSKKIPNMPIYMAYKYELRTEDVDVFLERGVRAFIKWNDDAELADELAQIADMVYMQARVDELSSRGRVLSYNTAQQLKGDEANINFYDFKIEVAADAEENKLLLSDGERPEERFADVIGADLAKEELAKFVDYLKNPKKFLARSVKVPNGILLYGPPGTGKTMLARAMAGESDVAFIQTSATDFMNKWYGESEASVRKLFTVAKKFAPSVIFIDEIDAIGKKRTGSGQSAASESVLNTLLTQMQGFKTDPTRPVFVMAATNYGVDENSGIGEGLDPALLRRFDNQILVDLPEEKDREKYLNILLKKIKDKSVSPKTVHNVAQRTTGESLATIKNIVERALRKSNGGELTDDILLNAYEEYMFGEKKEWSQDYYDSVAIHESGHAYISFLSGEKPSFVTIVSRGDFGGYMQHQNPEKTPSYTKEDLIWHIRTALAGRAAEIVFFGEEKGINTGISGDIKSATGTAFRMLYSYAMSENSMAYIPYDRLISSQMGDDAINKVNELLEQEMKNTIELITKGKKHVKKLADYLAKHNQATEEKICEVFKDVK